MTERRTPATTMWSRSPRAVEAAIATLIFCVGTCVGVYAVRAFRAAGGVQYFYQGEFGPAVMLACGGGLRNPDAGDAPALDAFLFQRADAFDCANVAAVRTVRDLDGFQRGIRYLEIAVALTWKVTGVSWTRLAILPGIFFGAVAALTYGVLRLGLSRPWALLTLLPAVTSTSNFMLVPQLRDYAKGVFLIAIILIMGVIVIGSTTRRRLVLLAVGGGAVVGLGLGFRTDLLIAVFPFVLTVAFLPPPAVPARARAAAIALFFLSFALVAWPVLRGYSKGGNIGHVVLLGFGNDFDKPLGIEPSIYEFVSQYNDSLVFTIINSYAIRVEGRRDGVMLGSVVYEGMTTRYLRDMAAVFPADFVTRGLAAIRRVPEYFLDSALYPPMWVRSPFAGAVYSLRGRIFWHLASLAVLAVALVTLTISAIKPRAAWLIIFVLIGFAGVSALQFHERHFYYLQFVPWLTFGLIAQAAVGWRRFFGSLMTTGHLFRALAFGAVIAAVTGAAIGLSRAWQQRTATSLFARYETAMRVPVALRQRPEGPGRTSFAAPGWLQPLPSGLPWIETRFLAARFHDDLCGPVNVPVTLRYQGSQPDVDLSSPTMVRLRPGGRTPTTLYFPAYDRADGTIRFRGIELASDQARCLASISRVEGLDHTPLLLTTVLSANWRATPLYQRMR